MGMPRKLKNINLFNDGNNFLGLVESFTPPKLTRKLEPYRGGGMNGAVNTDMGMDDGALDCQFVCGGMVRQLLQQYGALQASGILLRFTAAQQRDDSADVDAVEFVLRGRYKEIDRGELKPGTSNSTTVSCVCTYYKETVNGQIDIEVDLVNMIEVINGVDTLAAQRRALGIA